MLSKRKVPSSPGSYTSSPAKRVNTTNGVSQSPEGEDGGVVQRAFYPLEMSNERCLKYTTNELPRPLEVLQSTLQQTAEARLKISTGESIVHWFKRDLRTIDNTALSRAAQKAQAEKKPLICLFVISPQDYQAHLTSACRVDFELRTLQVLRQDLEDKDIPLFITTVDRRKTIPNKIVEFCQQWGANHIFCNIEYEVDELRREESLVKQCLEAGINFTALHDDAVVTPGALATGPGEEYSVYSPWYRAWQAHLHSHPSLLQTHPSPSQNPPDTRQGRFKDLFNQSSIPSAPPNKTLTSEEKTKFAALWPAGEHEALARLKKFLEQRRINDYDSKRNFPSANGTAVVSVHLASGTLSARTCVRAAHSSINTNSNNSRQFFKETNDNSDEGVKTWISELAWRDFYKHVLVHWPYVCMHKPYQYKYSNIKWEYSDSSFAAWCAGKTGYPIVDAAMRQLAHTGYMHNRCRMITASFLSKDLLLDWRLGERFFMESLIDGDFASNNGGWQFSVSCGVDALPHLRILNPVLQSEKFDPDGAYIRKWVPELKGVVGRAVHDPYGRGQGPVAERAGYPKPIVAHKEARDRCLQRFREGIAKGEESVK